MKQCPCRGGNKDCSMCGGLGTLEAQDSAPVPIAFSAAGAAPVPEDKSLSLPVRHRMLAPGLSATMRAAVLADKKRVAAREEKEREDAKRTKRRLARLAARPRCPECERLFRNAAKLEAHRAAQHIQLATPPLPPPGRG